MRLISKLERFPKESKAKWRIRIYLKEKELKKKFPKEHIIVVPMEDWCYYWIGGKQ